MTRTSARRMLRKIALTATVGAISPQLTLGQNPQTPAQRDATRPPGTQQNQPIPPQARPVSPDPTAPPGTQRVNPSAPPGTNTAPAPGQTAPPTSVPPTTVQPGGQQAPPATQ